MSGSATSPLPKSLRIGPYTWQVCCSKKAWKRLDQHTKDTADGVCDNQKHLITIRPGLDVEYERVCLVHEIFHACRDSAHLTKLDLNDAEESFINSVAPLYYAVLHDNPDLLDYLGLC